MGTCKATAKHGPGYDWEALRAHLREADLEDYITKVSGTVFHGPESNRRGKCPLHNGNNNTSFKVSCHDGVWRYRCFSQCGSGDIIDFAEKFQGYSRKDAPLLVAKALGIDPQRGTASYKQPAKKPARAIIEPVKPVIDWELRDGITPTTVQEMKASSPVPLDQHPRELIKELFEPDDLVCAGRDVRHSLIRKTPEWRNCLAMDTWQFICPNPMKSIDGRRQRLNVDNTSYFVVDIDEFSAESFVTPIDQCMTVINELALNMHLTMVVATGGKGAHGWFYIGHEPDNLEAWMEQASKLGADPAMRAPNQWARLPNGTRENGNRQSLLYLNPTKPIQVMASIKATSKDAGPNESEVGTTSSDCMHTNSATKKVKLEERPTFTATLSRFTIIDGVNVTAKVITDTEGSFDEWEIPSGSLPALLAWAGIKNIVELTEQLEVTCQKGARDWAIIPPATKSANTAPFDAASHTHQGHGVTMESEAPSDADDDAPIKAELTNITVEGKQVTATLTPSGAEPIDGWVLKARDWESSNALLASAKVGAYAELPETLDVHVKRQGKDWKIIDPKDLPDPAKEVWPDYIAALWGSTSEANDAAIQGGDEDADDAPSEGKQEGERDETPSEGSDDERVDGVGELKEDGDADQGAATPSEIDPLASAVEKSERKPLPDGIHRLCVTNAYEDLSARGNTIILLTLAGSLPSSRHVYHCLTFTESNIPRIQEFLDSGDVPYAKDELEVNDVALIGAVVVADVVTPNNGAGEAKSKVKRWLGPDDPSWSETRGEVTTEYYDASSTSGGWLIKNGYGDWMKLDGTAYKDELKTRGIRLASQQGENLSPGGRLMVHRRMNQNVLYAGALAGWREGYYEDDAERTRFLVTREAKLVEPVEGDWPTIYKTLDGLLGLHKDQLPVFMLWMGVAYRALAEEQHAPGQALICAGPSNCGKNLFQDLITRCLGGRSANPALYMSGRSDFNEELFGAEHLMMSDENLSTSPRDRNALGEAMKSVVADTNHKCHGKGKMALDLKPRWRLTMTLNEEPEKLKTLPPFVDSFAEKVILLHARQFEFCMPMRSQDDKNRFFDQLMEELPGFLHSCINMKGEKHLTTGKYAKDFERYGVGSWKSNTLMEKLRGISPQAILLEMIDDTEELFLGGTNVEPVKLDVWEGTTAKLRTELLTYTQFADREMLASTGKMGTYLSRLKKDYPERFESAKFGKNRDRGWRIRRATEESTEADT